MASFFDRLHKFDYLHRQLIYRVEFQKLTIQLWEINISNVTNEFNKQTSSNLTQTYGLINEREGTKWHETLNEIAKIK